MEVRNQQTASQLAEGAVWYVRYEKFAEQTHRDEAKRS